MSTRTQRSDRVADLDDHRELSPQERQQAETGAQAWASWSNAVNARLENIEAKLALWFGDGSEGSESALAQVVGETAADMDKALASRAPVEALATLRSEMLALLSKLEGRIASALGPDQLRRIVGEMTAGMDKALAKHATTEAVVAMREEMLIEVAVVRDELLSKIESKLFGVALADFDPDQFRRVIGDLKTEIAALAGSLAELATRIDSVDRRRRGDRNGWHKEYADLTTKLTAFAAMAARLTIKGWKLDPAAYTATPQMSDGSSGPPLELREMFAAFFSEAVEGK